MKRNSSILKSMVFVGKSSKK
jgi:hypothetical protein